MARVVAIGIGSRGDVQPILALALALREAGHAPLVAAPPEFAGWADKLGLPFAPVGRDVQAWLAERAEAVASPVATFREATGWIGEEIDDQYARLDEISEGADIVVGGGLVLAGAAAAEKRGVPYHYVIYSPQWIPAAEHPAIAVPFQRLPGWMNRLTHWAMRGMWQRLFLDRFNTCRQRMGLSAREDIWDLAWGREVILASEPFLSRSPEQSALPCPVTQVGALSYPEDGALDDELVSFVESGPAPVYVGFGSMTDPRPDRTWEAITSAVADAGQRAVIGWSASRASPAEIPAHCHVVESAPHGALFGRMAAVVHHGGAGTVATALRAGVPQVIVPHLFDQFYWGARVHDHGLGPRPVPRKQLTRLRLARSLDACLADGQAAERAKAAAVEVAKTDGCAGAVEVIERSLTQDNSPSSASKAT